MRQVPDTQEVFVSSNSDVSFVLEILERVEPSDPKDAAELVSVTSFVISSARISLDLFSHP